MARIIRTVSREVLAGDVNHRANRGVQGGEPARERELRHAQRVKQLVCRVGGSRQARPPSGPELRASRLKAACLRTPSYLSRCSNSVRESGGDLFPFFSPARNPMPAATATRAAGSSAPLPPWRDSAVPFPREPRKHVVPLCQFRLASGLRGCAGAALNSSSAWVRSMTGERLCPSILPSALAQVAIEKF